MQLVGPTQASCAESIIAEEDSTYAPVRYFGDNPANSPWRTPYGIPQANPGSKMQVAGADWLTNPRTQLRWMVTVYMGPHGTYASPCAAWAFRQAHGYY